MRGAHGRLILFSRHLASFLKSRVPVLRALQIMERQESDAGFKTTLRSLHNDLQQGRPLSGAMARFPKQFPPMYVAMARAGERGSALEETLRILAEDLKRQERTAKIIRNAAAYPIFLSMAGMATVIFIFTFVIPRLTVLFENMGKELPWATRVVISTGQFMRFGWPLLIAAVLIVFVLLPMLFRKRMGASAWDAYTMRMPFVGQLLFKTNFSRFCRSLKMSLDSGIHFLQAMDVAAPTLALANMREAVHRARSTVEKGGRFGESLANARGFPPLATDMIAVGEESGHLGEVLDEIAQIYEEEAEDRLKFMTTLLEPAMILVVGAIIGFVVIAMLLPVFEMEVLY